MVWDVLHGFRGMRKDAFQRMQCTRSGVTIDLESVVRAYRLDGKQYIGVAVSRIAGRESYSGEYLAFSLPD